MHKTQDGLCGIEKCLELAKSENMGRILNSGSRVIGSHWSLYTGELHDLIYFGRNPPPPIHCQQNIGGQETPLETEIQIVNF